jgi:hypothetical protein
VRQSRAAAVSCQFAKVEHHACMQISIQTLVTISTLTLQMWQRQGVLLQYWIHVVDRLAQIAQSPQAGGPSHLNNVVQFQESLLVTSLRKLL